MVIQDFESLASARLLWEQIFDLALKIFDIDGPKHFKQTDVDCAFDPAIPSPLCCVLWPQDGMVLKSDAAWLFLAQKHREISDEE